MLNGENFWLRLDGDSKRLGFYTTRYVEARDAKEAELAGVQQIRQDPKFQQVLNQRSDPPTIHVEQIVEVKGRTRSVRTLGTPSIWRTQMRDCTSTSRCGRREPVGRMEKREPTHSGPQLTARR